MHETLENSTSSSLALASPVPLIEHPAQVYLATLSPGSRPAMRQALNAIARLLTNSSCDAMTLNWAALRYKHTAAVRSVLSEKYAPAYVNKVLSALRRVLKEALRLEIMDAVDFARAVDIPNVKVTKQLRGRVLTAEEIAQLMQTCLHPPITLSASDLPQFHAVVVNPIIKNFKAVILALVEDMGHNLVFSRRGRRGGRGAEGQRRKLL